tara:strand:+ start:395 stop:667 length:273 start_codon:yes stop_codon:yes gene_type:complete
MHLILKDGTYAVGPFKPEGAIEVPPKPNRIETTWDGSQWVETEASKAVQYQRDRADAYDPIPEQLDQIYHDIDGWKAKIKSVKNKYPKPT